MRFSCGSLVILNSIIFVKTFGSVSSKGKCGYLHEGLPPILHSPWQGILSTIKHVRCVTDIVGVYITASFGWRIKSIPIIPRMRHRKSERISRTGIIYYLYLISQKIIIVDLISRRWRKHHESSILTLSYDILVQYIVGCIKQEHGLIRIRNNIHCEGATRRIKQKDSLICIGNTVGDEAVVVRTGEKKDSLMSR